MPSTPIVHRGRNDHPLWCQQDGCGQPADWAALIVVNQLTVMGMLACGPDLADALAALYELTEDTNLPSEVVALSLR